MNAGKPTQASAGWLRAKQWLGRGILILVGVTFLAVLATTVPKGWIWVVFFGVVFLVVQIQSRHEERIIRRAVAEALSGRPPMTDEEFGSHFYEPTISPIASRLRRLLALSLDCELAGMIPSDNFESWLQLSSGPDSAADFFFEELAIEFDLRRDSPWPKRFGSFDALVRFVEMHGGAGPYR